MSQRNEKYPKPDCCSQYGSSSSKTSFDFPCPKSCIEHLKEEQETPASCSQIQFSSSSSSSTVTIGLIQPECRALQPDTKGPPNINYEFALAKSLLQQYSTLSGDNLYDHLSDIIKRVIDERPPNIIDFFEEFSRNVREQKFHLPERFPPDAIFEESRAYRIAKKLLLAMDLPRIQDTDTGMDEDLEEENKLKAIDDLMLDLDQLNSKIFITFNERIQQLQFYWSQCGFSISTDDIFHLACSMNRLQIHPSIRQVRFWGVINGLKTSYYITEVSLSKAEITARQALMQEEMLRKRKQATNLSSSSIDKCEKDHIGPELTPGLYGWENWPQDEKDKMLPPVDPIPTTKKGDFFDIPPETIGTGLNRYSYFVVNSHSDDWIELPILTPKQLQISRVIKKFLTGDLEADIVSYPCFPGKEKHYLRALIARITCSTYIAPRGYFRKITKKEQRVFDGYEDNEEEDEEEEEEEELENEEGEEIDNDIMLLKNEDFEPPTLESMMNLNNWLHVRPNILNQGRIKWFDEVKARKEREKEIARLLKLQMLEEMDDEEEADEEEEEAGEEDLLEDITQPERGPPILQSINFDTSDEYNLPWVARFTSKYSSRNERVLVLRSNTWPGAFTFMFEKICENVYMGWGHKYLSRNMDYVHLPRIQEEYVHGPDDFVETTDPTVEEEEAYRQWLLKKMARDAYGDMGEYDEDNDIYQDNESDEED